MANRKPAAPFKKGNKHAVGKGRPKLPKEVRELQKLTKTKSEEILSRLAHMKEVDIKAMIESPETIMIEKMVASTYLKALEQGDQNRINWLLDRTVGKVKETTEIILPRPTIIERDNGQVIELGAEDIKQLTSGSEE